MRKVKRPRRYVARHWLMVAAPLFRYSPSRDAYVLRLVGSSVGPVLRVDRRRERSRGEFHGAERRRSAIA